MQDADEEDSDEDVSEDVSDEVRLSCQLDSVTCDMSCGGMQFTLAILKVTCMQKSADHQAKG